MSEQYSLKAVLSAQDKNFTQVINTVSKKIEGLENKIKGMHKPIDDTFGKGNPFAKFAIVTTGVSKAFDLVSNSVSGAVKRFDTMHRFPKVMEKLGFSTEDSNKAVNKLSKGIEGLPTRLDEVVSTAQNFALMNGNLDKSVELTLALNNAFIASGAGAEDASRGLLQFQQMASANKVDMQSWRTLLETMPLALNEVAKSFGYVGESAKNDLYEALKHGHITFKEFGDRIIELSKKTGGFADVAKTASEGIGTSFTNIKSAVIKGVTKVIENLDKMSVALTGKNIAQNLDSLKHLINGTFNGISAALGIVTPLLQPIGWLISGIGKAASYASPLLVGLGTALITLMIVEKVRNGINNFDKTLLTLRANTTKTIYSIGEFVLKSVGASTSMGALGAAAAVAGGGLKGFAVAVKLAVASIPVVGWVIAGVTAAIGALVYVLSRTSKEMEEHTKHAEEMTSKTEEMSSKIKGSASAFESQKTQLTSTKESMKDMINRVHELAGNSNRTSKETKELNGIIKTLNAQVGDNVFQFDKQTGKLNASKEAMQAYIDVAMKEKELEAIQKRIIELRTERIENDSLQKKVTEDLTEAEKKYGEQWQGLVGDGKKAKEAVNNLKEAKENAAKTSKEITAKEKALMDELKTKQEEVNNAIIAKQKEKVDKYVELNEEEKKVLEDVQKRYDDLAAKATNAFDVINQKQAISVEKMIENLTKNQEAISKFGENMETLRNRLANLGLDDALLNQFQKMGPEAGLQLATLLETSDEKLKELAEKMSNGFTVAGDSSAKAVKNATEEKVLPAVKGMTTKAVEEMQTGMSKDKFQEIGKNVGQGTKEGINDSKPQTVEATGDLRSAVLTKLKEGTKEEATKAGNDISQGLGEGTTAKKGDATTAVETVRNESQDKFVDVWKAFQKYGSELVEGLRNGVGIHSSKPANEMAKVIRKIENAFDYKKQKMYSIGQNLMYGLVNGMNSESSYVYNTAYDIAYGAVIAARRAARVHSPSRATMEIGSYMGQGLSIGLDKEQDRVNKSMMNLVDTSGFKNELDYQLQGINTSLDNNVNTSINSELTVNSKPMMLNLQLFGKTFTAFVDDITEVQDKKINLKMEYT